MTPATRPVYRARVKLSFASLVACLVLACSGVPPIERPDGSTDVPRDAALPDGGGPTAFAEFRRGVNPGYYGSGIDRRESAQLSMMAGIDSLRTPLPESYLAQWGEAIEVGDWTYYQTLGLDHHVVFLIGPTREHSSAPASAQTWELDHYAPRNLYEPIFLGDGTVNPENYWASYVARVARTYGDRIDIYEVWNEPDQVGGNWMATQDWDTDAPAPSELIWWNDTIYSYIRALRIAHAVVHSIDPNARVTVGGVGYPKFLNAVLRYTDNPEGGATSAAYPSTGAAYLDALSFHYYPVFGGGSSDRGVEGFVAQHDAMRAELERAGIGDIPLVATESGAPRYALGTYPGGGAYSANYLVKLYTLARYHGMLGVDWFAQGDGAAMGASDDSFDYMGLFFDYSGAQNVPDVRISPQGRAYAWVGEWLDDLAPDPAGLTALGLSSEMRGAAFIRRGGGHVYVLWAALDDTMPASMTYTLRTTSDFVVRSFNPASGGTMQSLSPMGGTFPIELGPTPVVIETP
jgi:hypothetical protein